MKRNACLIIGFMWIICFINVPVDSAYAQATIQMPNRASQYHLGASDELLIPVNIWGFVKQPGQYMVPNKTDLISLLSYAGGPTEGAKISKVQLVRSDPNMGRMVMKINIKQYLDEADASIIPILKPGDTIVLKGTTFNWVQKFFSFLSTFAVFAQMFYFIAIASDYNRR